MIINKKLIQKIIKESVFRLLIERAKFSKAQNFLKNPDNKDAILYEIDKAYKKLIKKMNATYHASTES